MYSGTILRAKSGNVMGAHQRIDRISRRHLKRVLPDRAFFPTSRQIVHFEGLRGPDGIKRKSPGRDEPWHFIDPSDPDDRALVQSISDHMTNLERALGKRDEVRAAFEAAWLAHAIVDGLTPAHHYPFEEKLEQLREGESKETRTSFRSKVVMPGSTPRMQIKNNWDFWGAKGMMTSHALFEWGFATTISSLRLETAVPSKNELIRAKREGIEPLFLEAMQHIHSLKMYETFQKKGWHRPLAQLTRTELAPVIVKTVTLAWYAASMRAEMRKKGQS